MEGFTQSIGILCRLEICGGGMLPCQGPALRKFIPRYAGFFYCKNYDNLHILKKKEKNEGLS
jgi:hypothetical protein